MSTDLMMSAVHGEGLNICGVSPRARLTTIDKEPCWNCAGTNVVRRFSGSGWYEDDFLCTTCGENVGTGYRPFERAWRKKNIARAEEWLVTAVPRDEYLAQTLALINKEMGWDNPTPAELETEGTK